jgi:hypothetical protein
VDARHISIGTFAELPRRVMGNAEVSAPALEINAIGLPYTIQLESPFLSEATIKVVQMAKSAHDLARSFGRSCSSVV